MPGSQKIAEEIERMFAHAEHKPRVVILDASMIQDRSQAEEELVHTIHTVRPLIVIASQMIFSHRYDLSFESIAVPSLDGLMSIPEYRSEEKMLYQLTKLLDFKPQKMILQTYQPSHHAIKAFVEHDWQSLYSAELEMRKSFAYPPFSTIAKLTYAHANRATASTQARVLSEKLKIIISQLNLTSLVHMIGPTPAFIAQEKNRYSFHLILKIRPEEKLDRILKYVPSGWLIDIDPNDVL